MRFRTSPTNPSTDFDCVLDQDDMVGILYHPVNVYLPAHPDINYDGKYKYLDPDNDNGSAIDGDEDVNWNGHIDLGETIISIERMTVEWQRSVVNPSRSSSITFTMVFAIRRVSVTYS